MQYPEDYNPRDIAGVKMFYPFDGKHDDADVMRVIDNDLEGHYPKVRDWITDRFIDDLPVETLLNCLANNKRRMRDNENVMEFLQRILLDEHDADYMKVWDCHKGGYWIFSR